MIYLSGGTTPAVKHWTWYHQYSFDFLASLNFTLFYWCYDTHFSFCMWI